jgi:hypothetical protein
LVTSAETERTVTVSPYGEGTGIAANHVGWNLVGIPYLSHYSGNGLNANYVNFFNGSTYDQYAKGAIGRNIYPFEAFFIQASAATTNTSLACLLANRQLVKSSVSQDESDQVQLNLQSATGVDRTNLIIDDTQSVDYVINQDLNKWLTTGTSKPQLYTLLNGESYAYNGLPYQAVQNLQLGYYVKNSGETTLSADLSQASGIEQLLLTDNLLGITTDLKRLDYRFNSDAGTVNNRFSLSAQRIATSTSISNEELDSPICTAKHLTLLINKLTGKTVISVYNTLGALITKKFSSNSSVEIALEKEGIYLVNLSCGNKSWVKKVIVK